LAGRCLLPKLGQRLLLLALNRLGQLALTPRVHVALECPRQLATGILEELAHVANQLLPLAARQDDGGRPPWIAKIVALRA
jgi:hypothetical protein